MMHQLVTGHKCSRLLVGHDRLYLCLVVGKTVFEEELQLLRREFREGEGAIAMPKVVMHLPAHIPDGWVMAGHAQHKGKVKEQGFSF